MKLCKDTSIYDEKFTDKSAAKVYKSSKPQGVIKMSFMHFMGACAAIAEIKGQGREELMTYLSMLKPSVDHEGASA